MQCMSSKDSIFALPINIVGLFMISLQQENSFWKLDKLCIASLSVSMQWKYAQVRQIHKVASAKGRQMMGMTKTSHAWNTVVHSTRYTCQKQKEPEMPSSQILNHSILCVLQHITAQGSEAQNTQMTFLTSLSRQGKTHICSGLLIKTIFQGFSVASQ